MRRIVAAPRRPQPGHHQRGAERADASPDIHRRHPQDGCGTNRTRPLEPNRRPPGAASPRPASVDKPGPKWEDSCMRLDEGVGVAAPRPVPRLRVHQSRALEAIERAERGGARRAWVVLPPGAGKTLVGLETARRRGRTTVVLGPNTAIQTQWLRGWDAVETAPAGATRDVDGPFTALTYQSVATFEDHDAVDDEGAGAGEPAGVAAPERPRAGRAPQAARRPDAGARRVPPPRGGLGPAAGRAARRAPRRVRARADRDAAQHPDRGPEGARRRAVRRAAVHREHPRGGARGRPRTVRGARLADHADADRDRLAGRAGPTLRRADHGAERPDVRVDQLLRLARRPLPGRPARATRAQLDAALRLVHAGLLDLPAGATSASSTAGRRPRTTGCS